MTTPTPVTSANDTTRDFVQHGVDEIFNRRNLEYVDELYARDVVDHSAPPGLPDGIEGVRQKVAMFLGAFPDLEIRYEFTVVEGGLFAGRFTLTGTHRGDFAGVPPSGSRIEISGHDLLRIRAGKVSEHWLSLDSLDLMQQLGAIAT